MIYHRFCRDFTSFEDLWDDLIRYMPVTFNYDHVQGTYDEEEEEVCSDMLVKARGIW